MWILVAIALSIGTEIFDPAANYSLGFGERPGLIVHRHAANRHVEVFFRPACVGVWTGWKGRELIAVGGQFFGFQANYSLGNVDEL